MGELDGICDLVIRFAFTELQILAKNSIWVFLMQKNLVWLANILLKMLAPYFWGNMAAN